MITVSDLSMNFGGQTLFQNADLQLHDGRRYGIVGANGSGKSTFLKILSGEVAASGGEVVCPKRARIGVLEQDHFQHEDTPILDLVMMGNRELWDAMVEKEEVLARAEEYFDDERYSRLEDIVLRFDGYGLEARAGKILEGLGIPTSVHREPLRVLSGGFKLRALLARTLAAEPDLLFLDEPTNHLDILAIKWLEEFLSEFRGCAVVVSHDLRFLDATCTDILDVDYARITAYRGNYSDFVRLKTEHAARMEAEIAKRKKEIDEHKAFIARFSAKATKARQANSRQKRMEKIVIEELPQSSRRHPKFRFQARRQSGREVLAVKGLHKAFDDKQVLHDVSFTVQRGDRLAIIGPNGVGKSTLLKICMGVLEADQGTTEWGYEVDTGYFPQDHGEALGSPIQSVQSALWDVLPEEGLGAILSRLAAVLFSKDDSDKKIENLSGGEAARLLFAKIAAKQPTVLVLDEPTNHLDLEGIEALSEALRAYDGTLLFVSHDRWFVDQLATRVLDIRPDRVEDFQGSYSAYLAKSEVDHLDVEAVAARAKRDRRAKKRSKKQGHAVETDTKPAAVEATTSPTAARPKRSQKKHRNKRTVPTDASPVNVPERTEATGPKVRRRKAEDAPKRGRRRRRR